MTSSFKSTKACDHKQYADDNSVPHIAHVGLECRYESRDNQPDSKDAGCPALPGFLFNDRESCNAGDDTNYEIVP
jgi:hypothetical protein